MKNRKNILILIFCIFITAMFFTYQVVITYDTSHYLWLTSLLSKGGDFSTWDVARGPVFPILIKTFNILFGQNTNGLLVGMFIFYILMLLGCYFIYKDTIKNEEHFNKKVKYILLFLFLLLVVFNPMVIGYYHALLTEFVGMTLSIIGCYLAWKWMDVNFKENKMKYSIYTVVLAILTAIAWQLKQPYVGTILFPIIIASIISFVRNINLKNFLQRLATIITCVIMLVTSIKIWNVILEKNNVAIKENRTSAGFFASGILGGMTNYNIQDIEDFDTAKEIEESTKITEEDKNKIKEILENKSDYKSYQVIDTNKENYKIIYLKGNVISTKEAISFLLSSLVKDPKAIIGGYVSNYLATISIHDIDFVENKIKISKNINLTTTKEIDTIGYKIYNYGKENVFYLSPEYEIYAEEHRSVNKPIININRVMRKLQMPMAITMKISYLVLPILVICSIIAVFVTKKRYNEKYCKIIDIITILYTFSLLHILAHSMLGSTIDRYTMPALVNTFIAILLSIYAIIYRKKYKKQ